MAKVLIFSIAVALLAALCIVLSASSVLAEPDRGSSTEDCLLCHNADPTGPMGNATQLYVAKHNSQVGECMTCHVNETESIHGMWDDTPDSCARCHRTHSAAAEDLLVGDKDALCLFCHGHDTGLAQTNVLDGVLRLNNAPLRGGGFDTVRMNSSTNLAASAAPGYPTSYPDEWQYPVGSTSSRDVTSKHTLKEYLPSGVGATTVWGSWNNPGMSSTPNAGDTNSKLECVSCHDPHAYGLTYRMLSRSPAGSGIPENPEPTDPSYMQPVFVTDQLTYARLNPNSNILSYTTDDFSNTWLGNKTWDAGSGTWVVSKMPETSYAAPYVLDPDTGNATMVYSMLGSSPMYSQQLSEWCSSCHDRYHAVQTDHTGPGNTDSGDAIYAYRHKTGDEKPVWNPATNQYESNSCGYSCHNNTQLNCLGCHVAHGTAAQMTPIIQAGPWPGTGGNATPPGHGTLPQDTRPEFTGGHDYDNEIKSNLLRIDNRGVCQNPSCHPKGKSSYLDTSYTDATDICARCHSGGAHSSGSDCTSCHTGSSMACDSCHGAPPATGAHIGHFGGNATLAAYGGTANLSTATDYIFQCGNCHPITRSSHLNGTVDMELYNAGAPGGSLKSLNPSTAGYTPGVTTYTDGFGIKYTLGTCSNVYCHSKTDWSSPNTISAPLMGNGTRMPRLDANGNLMYNAYTVTESKVYASVGWGGSAPDCSGCHRNNPQTSYPGVQAGVGNSHGWIDDYGWEDLHAWDMGFDALICRTCHYNTVTDSMTWTRDSNDIASYGDVPIANKSYHVNGIKDVAFDSVNTVVYETSGGNVTFSLSSTTYDLTTKVCSSTPCHINQENPEWGKPYRFGNSWECDQCHRMGRWPSSAPTGGSMMAPEGGLMAPGGDETASPTTLSPHAGDAELNCLDCHTGHGTGP